MTVSLAGVMDVRWARVFPSPCLCNDLVLVLKAGQERGRKGDRGRECSREGVHCALSIGARRE